MHAYIHCPVIPYFISQTVSATVSHKTLINISKAAQELLDELQSLNQVLTSLKNFHRAQSMKGRVFTTTSILTVIKEFHVLETD
jgi:hypothetical protein